MASESEINDVTEKVKEFAEISKTIKITQEKLKILNKKKNELYKEVIPRLKTSNISKCNLSFGTLKVVHSKRKIMPNKTTMKERYISFFNKFANTHEFTSASFNEKANILYNYIYVDNIEIKESSNLSMTYNKDFKDQFKNLSLN